MALTPPCPKCLCEYTYQNDALTICPECFYEWNINDIESESKNLQILDSNGVVLSPGDSVIIIKDLPVKGAPKAIKSGTKVKNIRLIDVENIHTGHNIDCKIDGFGAMVIKSEYVRKV